MFLSATTQSLEIDLNGAVAANQLPVVASYVDVSQSTFAMSAMTTATTQTNSTTAVTIVAAPGATTTRQIKFLSIKNSDTSPVLLWVQLNDNGTLREVTKCTLAVNDSLIYTDTDGWKTLDSNGAAKYSQSGIAVASGKTLTVNDSATIATNSITFGGAEVLTLTAAKNVTFADAFATSGANSLTLTTTGTTNATLPSGTKTLLATDGSLSNLTGILNAAVVASSLTSVGTLTGLVLGGNLTESGGARSITVTGAISGGAISGTTLTTTSGQVVFPATQNPSAGANTLDDYEEGTWTPNLQRSDGGFATTYTAQTGYYTKIGRQVTAYFLITINTISNASSGVNLIQGWPVNPAAVNGIGVVSQDGALTSDVKSIVTASNGNFSLYTIAGAAVNENFVNGGTIEGSVTYFTS